MPPLPRKSDEIAELVKQGVAAELANREQAEKLKKDPETMAELIDRISDATVDKVFARLDQGAGGEETPLGTKPAAESAPGVEHPWFGPLFKRAAS